MEQLREWARSADEAGFPTGLPDGKPRNPVEAVAAPPRVPAEKSEREWFRAACITNIFKETSDSVSFEFEMRDGEAFHAQPGQFVAIRFEIEGHTHERCYAVSSLVSRGEVPRFTVKRVSSGCVSNWCHDHLRCGAWIRVSPPTGQFRLHPLNTERAVFMAAGIGMAPIFPMIKEALLFSERAVRVMIFDRDEESAPFLAPLRAFAERYRDRLDLTEIYVGKAGEVTQDAIADHLAGTCDASIYMCGPPEFMRRAEAAAISVGLCEDRIFVNANAAIPALQMSPNERAQ
ncbi:ferredoxin--NADP reductase [Bradyrhizobium sp.]|uniref:ferredoxin--NADP reductase n=1 Tax=Bradyrhizobium sp. TaxID=376 RepID=UPI0039E6BE64